MKAREEKKKGRRKKWFYTQWFFFCVYDVTATTAAAAPLYLNNSLEIIFLLYGSPYSSHFLNNAEAISKLLYKVLWSINQS